MSRNLTLMFDNNIMSKRFEFIPSLQVNMNNQNVMAEQIKQRLQEKVGTNPDLQRLIDFLDTTNYNITFDYTDPYAAKNNEPLVIEKIIKIPKYDRIDEKINNSNFMDYDIYKKVNDTIINDNTNKNPEQAGGKKKRTSKKTSKKSSKRTSKKVAQAGGKKKASKKTSKRTSKKSSKKVAQAGGKKKASKKTSKKSSKKVTQAGGRKKQGSKKSSKKTSKKSSRK
jgi:hypothetical protein